MFERSSFVTDLTWRKARSCEAHSCVEVAFRRSSRCDVQHCLEVGATADAVLVRDSKLSAASPILSFTPAAWQAFVDGLRQ